MNKLISAFSALLALSTAHANEFTDFCASMGTVTNLVGIHQSATHDANGFAINFWQPGFEGANAASVALSNPHMAQADAFGNIYIADKSSHSILKLATGGTIHTLAGIHTAGFNGDGPAPGNTLQLNNPNGLYVFPNGTVYVLDPGNHRIRRIGTDGVMTTIVNDPDPNWYPSGRALWVQPDEQLIYYTNEYAPVPPSLIADGAAVKRWTPAGGISILCDKATGFRNPGNIAMNPIDGKLYVTDRAEDDATRNAVGLFRIDGLNLRTRITGNINNSAPSDGQPALTSFVEQPRGVAFLANGAYLLCGHKNGNVYYINTTGQIYLYLHGRGGRDYYNLTNGLHPPLTGVAPNGQEWFSQPRSVTLAPNGNILVVSNDSGFTFQVNNAATPHLPGDLRVSSSDSAGSLLNWSGQYSRGYRVEHTPTLSPPAWQIIGAAAGTPAGVPSLFFAPASGGQPQGFYRLLPSL